MRLFPLLPALICLIWLVGALISNRLEPIERVTAQYAEARICAEVTGVVIRDEILLTSRYAETLPVLPEGEKVGRGQTVALGFAEVRSGENRSEQTAAENRMQQLRAASESSPRTRNGEICRILVSLAVDPLRGDTERLKALILADTAEPEQIAEALDALPVQRDSAAQTAGIPLLASESGWFSGCVDGYEAVFTPVWLSSSEETVLPEPQPVSRRVYGKLIRSETWYFAADVPQTQLQELEAGETVTADFGGCQVGTVSMRVEQLTGKENGMCRLVLSCDRYIAEAATLRQQSCTLVFQTYSGLWVPRNAVCHNENGQAGVYVLEAAIARWKPITILHTEETGCIAELNRADTGNLWPGDEILLGKNLYDGKVVYP